MMGKANDSMLRQKNNGVLLLFQRFVAVDTVRKDWCHFEGNCKTAPVDICGVSMVTRWKLVQQIELQLEWETTQNTFYYINSYIFTGRHDLPLFCTEALRIHILTLSSHKS